MEISRAVLVVKFDGQTHCCLTLGLLFKVDNEFLC